jgi:hypothetical protein
MSRNAQGDGFGRSGGSKGVDAENVAMFDQGGSFVGSKSGER